MIPLSVMVMAAAVAGMASPAIPWEPSLLVQLEVSDLDRSIRFYTGTLGFRLTERRDDLRFAHLEFGVNGLQIGLSSGGEVPPDPGTITLNLGVRGDVAEARKILEGRMVAFRGQTVIIPGKVRLAEFRDPDGYRIRLAGEDPAAPAVP